MDVKPEPLLLANLRRYAAEAAAAIAKRERQLEACIEAGYDSVRLADCLGQTPGAVRNMQAWKEAKR